MPPLLALSRIPSRIFRCGLSCACRKGKAANRANEEKPQVEIREAMTREKEVRQAIGRGVSSMSPRELLNLPDGMMNVLGIER